MSLRVPGHAKINPRYPSALGCCDRCGFVHNHNELRFQRDYRGDALVSLNILVCPTCYDIPAEWVRPVILGPDPIPIRNPRPDLNATALWGQEVTTPVCLDDSGYLAHSLNATTAQSMRRTAPVAFNRVD